MYEIRPEASGSREQNNDAPKTNTPERYQDILSATTWNNSPATHHPRPFRRDAIAEDINPVDADSKKAKKLSVNVYIIIILQMLVTTAIVTPFLFDENTREYMKNEYPVPLNTVRLTGVVAVTTFLVLAIYDRVRLSFPTNMILLVVFTVSMGSLLGMSAAHRDPKAVIGAFFVAILICVLDTCATTFFHVTLPVTCGTLFVIEVGGAVALFIYLMASFGGVFELLLTIGVFLVVSQGTYLIFDIQNAVGVRKRDDVTEVLILYSDGIALFLLVHLIWTDVALLVR